MTQFSQRLHKMVPAAREVHVVGAYMSARAAAHDWRSAEVPQMQVGDFPGLPRILHLRKVIEQHAQPWLGRKGRQVLHQTLPNR